MAEGETEQKQNNENQQLQEEPQPRCPQCGSTKLYRDGLRYLSNGTIIQRLLCRQCFYRFSSPAQKTSDTSQRVEKVDKQILNSRSALTYKCQGSREASSRASTSQPLLVKTLVEAETRNEKWAAGATETKLSEAELYGRIAEFLWWMKKQGYKETTIRSKGSRLRRLVKLGVNLYDPESVKEVLAQQSWADSGKETTAYAYDLFAKWMGIKWERPAYKPSRKLPFIPLEREIDDLIAGCSNKSASTFLQIAKETGARAGEIFALKWTDVDFEGKTLRITPEKGSNPRVFKMSNKLASILKNLPKNGERIFSNYKRLKDLSRTFGRHRRKLAFKLGNPRLLRISFHTLRHWKATMEYHRTKDILYVMQLLGHRDIKNTLIYTQLIQSEHEDEYVCKVAETVKQAAELIEDGFEYVCDIEGVKLFRKRK